MAEPSGDAEKGGRRGAGEAQRIGQRHVEEVDAVAHGARHIEGGTGEGSVRGRASPVLNPDRLPRG